MLDNKRRIPLGYSNSLARDQENRPLDAYHRDRKQKNGEKKSYSISYEVAKDDPAQNSPHFLNAITSSRTEREVTELQTSLRETRVELERKAAKVENEITMRREMRKMKESMQYEQQKKLKELEESVNEYWTAKITKLHKNFQGQLSELEKSGEQNTRTSPPRKCSISELAKKIEEKHYREYVHKVDEIKQNFKKIDDENKMEIKKEIIKELEPIYKEQLSQSRVQYSSPTEVNQQNIERETRSSNRVNRLKLRTQESLERSLVNKSRATQSNPSEIMMTKEAEKIEEQLRREYQEDLHVIKKVHENDEKEIWKVFSKAEMRTRDKKRQEIEEKLNKEMALKEKAIELKFRQKMEAQQEAMKRNFELEVENQLKEEKKSLLEEKGEIGRLKSRANIKAHKVEEAKQAFYKKLKEQEEKFAKKVDNLQRELDGLKQGQDERDESPSLGQLKAQYLRKQQDQGEAALTTEKWKKSLRDQGKENRSKSPVTSKSFVGLKPPLSDSINERARSSQVRRKSYVVPEDMKRNNAGYSLQSTARENTSRMETSKEYQNPKYYLQKSVRGEQESSSPFNRSFNSKMSNIAVVAAKKDDSNRTMKAVLDAAQPPELLFSSKVDTVPLLPYRPKEDKYNRKPSGDTRDNMTTETLPSSYDITTRRRSLIKNESSVEYGKLKAEIMSKYEPGQNRLRTADMSFMDGMAKSRQDSSQGKKTPDNALEKAKLAEQRKKEFTDKYNKSLKKMEFERSAKKKENERQYTGYTETGASLENSRLLTLNPEEKYREIMEKYLDKSVAQKYEVTEKMKRSSGYIEIGGKYQELFKINEDENAQTKSMKRFKKVIEAAIEKDNALEAKYLAREVFFTTDFITSLDSDNKYLKETLKGKFRHLFEGWNVTETSYEARLKFLGELDLMLNLENVIRKVDAEIEYLSQYSYEIGEIIGLLKQRNKLKGKVNVKKFEYSLYKGVYGMIDEVLGEMKVLLQDYHRLRKREVIYKGIDLSDIIKVDMWEHAYLDEVEEREVLWEKVKHRH